MVSRWEWCADYDATTRNKYKYKFKWNRKAGIGANLQRTDVNGYSDDDGSIHEQEAKSGDISVFRPTGDARDRYHRSDVSRDVIAIRGQWRVSHPTTTEQSEYQYQQDMSIYFRRE